MKHNCESCNYSTDDSGNWNKHIKSKKHIKLIDEYRNTSKNEIREVVRKELGDIVGNQIIPSMNEMITEQLKLIIDRIKNGNVENNTIEIVPTAPHDTDKKVFVCQSCKIECSRASSLTRHIKKCILAKINVIDDDNDELIKLGDVSTRQQKPSETAENDKNNKKELECQYCGITCKRSCNLIQHMNKCAKIIKV